MAGSDGRVREQWRPPARADRRQGLWIGGLALLAFVGAGLGWVGASLILPRDQGTPTLHVAAAHDVGASTEQIEVPTPAAPQGSPPQVAASGPPSDPGDGETTDAEVRAAIAQWRDALLSNDVSRIGPMYAAKVDRYFLKTDVDRGFVTKDKAAEEASGTKLHAYSLDGLTIEHAADGTVNARFVTNFLVGTPRGERGGQTRTELKLRREDGAWKVFSERDFNS